VCPVETCNKVFHDYNAWISHTRNKHKDPFPLLEEMHQKDARYYRSVTNEWRVALQARKTELDGRTLLSETANWHRVSASCSNAENCVDSLRTTPLIKLNLNTRSHASY